MLWEMFKVCFFRFSPIRFRFFPIFFMYTYTLYRRLNEPNKAPNRMRKIRVLGRNRSRNESTFNLQILWANTSLFIGDFGHEGKNEPNPLRTYPPNFISNSH